MNKSDNVIAAVRLQSGDRILIKDYDELRPAIIMRPYRDDSFTYFLCDFGEGSYKERCEKCNPSTVFKKW